MCILSVQSRAESLHTPTNSEGVGRFGEIAGERSRLSAREEFNAKVYTLRKHTGWGYGRIGKELGLSKSRVRDVVKRGDERSGDVKVALRTGRPTKLTKEKRKRVVDVVDKNPRLSLQDITNKADVGISKTSVRKILHESGFCLKIPRKKPFWRPG